MAADQTGLTHDPPRHDPNDAVSTVSRGIVGIYANNYGRGPTHARTYMQEDYVLTVLEESFTVAERTLLRAGKVSQVEEIRHAFQEAVSEDFIKLVEDATGRKVATFVSQVDAASETAVEVFLLEPRDGGSRVGRS